MTRKFLLAVTGLVSVLTFSGVVAAQPVTGLYIGAAGGANFLQREQGIPFDTGVVGVGSAGYGFGNGLRVELEGDYRNNRFSSPNGTTALSFGGKEQKYGGMANVLFDLDVGSPYVFPYIGGGAGYSWVAQQSLFTSSGFGARFTQARGGTDGSFAYQAIAGLSFPIPYVVGLSLTAEYRYFSLAETRSFTITSLSTGGGGPASGGSGQLRTKGDYNHSLMLGLRYAFNVAPPPVVVATPAPTPPVEAARTYLVFFDWDRADLTDRARQIIAEAAQATTRVQTTRIEVSGHTDTTGSAAYNQGLSVRRAQNVAAELVRLGVPRSAITTQGFGFSRPLVATGPGVREPQNRRVEIVLR